MIGILPAAGKADRMHGIPKFLLPVGDTYLLKWHQQEMYNAGVDSVYIGRSFGYERVIADHLINKSRGYTVNTKTMTATVLDAKIWNGDQNVLFGMPDTYFCEGAYQQVVTGLNADTDVMVGLFKIRPEQRGKVGQVALKGVNIVDVVDKDPQCEYPYVWGLMAWKPSFWKCLHDDMPHVGYGLPQAIAAGLKVRGIVLEGDYWDCGTPDEYFGMIIKRHFGIRSVDTHNVPLFDVELFNGG